MSQIVRYVDPYCDYTAQNPMDPSTYLEKTEIVNLFYNSPNREKQERSRQLYPYDIFSFIQIDLSSIWPKFHMENKTLPIEEFGMERSSEALSEEDIVLAMLENDVVLKMSPKRRYKTQVYVRSIKKGKPVVVESNDFLYDED